MSAFMELKANQTVSHLRYQFFCLHLKYYEIEAFRIELLWTMKNEEGRSFGDCQ